ncbi:MAG: precorrin-8X methylmutase [Candidatus Methanoperedens nitroreducens]|uniref:Precorrin-8X methylmutase n=1 Tax=Candidatus Methanoperedens nitratireducens TaxID=1392998 RepID=A0A0P8E1R0_9EURY|nr:MAG: precorrin-8X methylmutase [Candidatus Methanoperedens sp. BLZ1]
MNIEFGARTREAKEINEKSWGIVQSFIKGDTPQDRIRQRCVIATGDLAFAELMRFNNDPVNAGIDAIRNDATIFTDIRMAQVGITKQRHKCDVRCVLDVETDIARDTGVTRTSAGFVALGKELNDAIIVIGNAPSAVLTVCRLIDEGLHPALLVATPVGFVNAAESKELVRTLVVPSITCIGTRGGTPVGCGCC